MREAKVALLTGESIRTSVVRLRDLVALAERAGVDHDDRGAVRVVADFWSVLAKCEQAAGVPVSAITHARMGFDFLHDDPDQVTKAMRLHTVVGDATLRLGEPHLAIGHATRALQVADDDPYLQARARYALQSALNEDVAGRGAIVITDRDLAVIAETHSPALAAVGSVLRMRAAIRDGDRDLKTHADVAEAFMAAEDGAAQIQRLQVAEANIIVNLRRGDRSAAESLLAEFTPRCADVEGQEYRIERLAHQLERHS